LSAEKKKTDPECGFGAPGMETEMRSLPSASVRTPSWHPFHLDEHHGNFSDLGDAKRAHALLL
jgi:hypothetical protein